MAHFRKSSATKQERWNGMHRFEHWYRDNTVCFITSKVREGHHAFASPEAQSIFWDRFTHYSKHYGYVPWVTSLMSNHYHTLGYLKVGENLGPLMRQFHGSVAKLVNDLLPVRHLPFWRTAGNQDYFDECIRDVLQATRAYRYSLHQSERHGITTDWKKYRNTRVNVEMGIAIKRAVELRAFLEDLSYRRYEKNRDRRGAR